MFTRKRGGVGKPTHSQGEGAGKGHCLTWVGKAREGSACPKWEYPTLGRKGYQGGKWRTRKPSPPLRKRKKLATFRGGHGICSSDTGWARAQATPCVPPTLSSARGSVPITWGRTTYPQVPSYKAPTSPTLAGSRRFSYPHQEYKFQSL